MHIHICMYMSVFMCLFVCSFLCLTLFRKAHTNKHQQGQLYAGVKPYESTNS